jgi:phosphoglycolate phosphatase
MLVGQGARKLVESAMPRGQHDATAISTILTEYQAEYSRTWNATTRPYDGIEALLDSLCARGIKMAVLSNKPDAFTKLCVNELLPRWSFEAVLGQTDSLPMKPDPAGPREIARMLGRRPDRFLYLGDSGVDMETAVNAGMYPVGVLWGFRSRSELLASGARTLIESPTDLVVLLAELEHDR